MAVEAVFPAPAVVVMSESLLSNSEPFVRHEPFELPMHVEQKLATNPHGEAIEIGARMLAGTLDTTVPLGKSQLPSIDVIEKVDLWAVMSEVPVEELCRISNLAISGRFWGQYTR